MRSHSYAGTCLPVGADITRPSIARVYDYSLGGKDNYDVDRAAFERVLAVAPRQREVSRMNRDWLYRVVRYLAGQTGIDQQARFCAVAAVAGDSVSCVSQGDTRFLLHFELLEGVQPCLFRLFLISVS